MLGFKSKRSQEIDDYLAVAKPHESQETKVYKALKRAGKHGAYNTDLARICLSWHRRIGDLRKQGINVQHVRVTNGLHKYYLGDEE